MAVKFSANLNGIALLRNRRNLPWPNIEALGRVALLSGANGLTVHPRPDQRHINYADVAQISSLIRNEFPQCEFNLEGFPNPEFLALVEKSSPKQVTLVPDTAEQSTSDHGWDFISSYKKLSSVVRHIQSLGCRVSLFSDPEPDSSFLQAAADTGADRIELYTGLYGACYKDRVEAQQQLEKLSQTGEIALSLGLGVNAGHDLTVDNLPAFLGKVPFVSEISVGHALIADSLQFGISVSVARFLEVCRSGSCL